MLFRFVERKIWYFALSALLIIPGVFFIAIGGLKPGIEFKGGTLLHPRFGAAPTAAKMTIGFVRLHQPEAAIPGAEGGPVMVAALQLQSADVPSIRQRVHAEVPLLH